MNSDLQFEWDKEKEKANRLKHNISFESAKWVFRDDFRIEYFDEAHSKDEDRFITIGQAGQTLLVKPMLQKGESTMTVKSTLSSNDVMPEEVRAELEALKDKPVTYDEDCPQLTEEQLAQFRLAIERRQEERRREPVTLRLHPQALRKAKSLGKGYTRVLSDIVETVLNDDVLLKSFL